jgi:hypothetical protein
MKEFILTMPYSSTEEMANSGEVAVYKEELQQSGEEKYAIVSRIGNRYDVFGNRIGDFAINPFLTQTQEEVPVEIIETITEEKEMKYAEIEALIDREIEKAVTELTEKHQLEIAELTRKHTLEIAEMQVNAKAQAKAEILALLNA